MYADTASIIDACGGIGIEASPWNFKDVSTKLKSGTIDGLLLTGGSDVNPARYGQKPCHYTQTPDDLRDFVELHALDYAREHKIPVLGICRGSQIMCVSSGGTLTQDIQLYREPWYAHGGTQHDAIATDDAITFRQACLADDVHAMSLHHQCVDTVGPGMRIAATAKDGTPEAIESKDGLWLGVQFHPEMSAFENSSCFSIFRWLVETAARRKGGKAPAVNFRDAVDDYYDSSELAWTTWVSEQEEKERRWWEDSPTSSSTRDPGGWTIFDPYDDDDSYEEGTTASNPGRKKKAAARYKPRKAGDPSIPSMREPEVIDGTCIEVPFGAQDRNARAKADLENALHTCPSCAMKFDCIEDCDDHIRLKVCQKLTDEEWMNQFRPFACSQCNSRFRDTESRDHHEDVMHYRFPSDRYPDMHEPLLLPPGPAIEDTLEACREAGLEVDDIIN